MQLPKYKKKRREKLKICQEPGCGKEFWGHPIAKYCELHRDIRFRQRRKRVYESVDVRNQVFNHKFHEVTDVEFACQVPGCNRRYIIHVFPKQYVYPKYCEEHRNEFKRESFIRVKCINSPRQLVFA